MADLQVAKKRPKQEPPQVAAVPVDSAPSNGEGEGSGPVGDDADVTLPALVRDDDDAITSYKAYRRESRLLGKIGALLDKSQPETLRHFRRQFENLYFTLLAAEQRNFEGTRLSDPKDPSEKQEGSE